MDMNRQRIYSQEASIHTLHQLRPLDWATWLNWAWKWKERVSSENFVLIIFYVIEASKPESLELLPHIRGQGIMDLEYENEGMCRL